MRRLFTLFIVLLLVVFSVEISASSAAGQPGGCTVLIAGKNTTADGSILFAKTEDDGRKDVDFLWYIPRKRHAPGAVVELHAGGAIPQADETYAYFWDECPGTSYSNAIVNEWGVAFGSNGCMSKEDPVEAVEARGDLVDGGLGFRLRMILAERSRTAREAVTLAARLIDRYGYNASGRNLNIVGPKEAWQLQMVRGRNYAARRVQDDEVVIIANTFSIREVDLNDTENFICSPGLIDYAVERGWYDPEGGDMFDFARAYAPEKIHTSPSNTRRQWNLARLLNGDFPITWRQAEAGMMPVSVKPDRKLTLKDVMVILRDHYEGTALDESGGYKKSPHKTRFTICNYNTHRSTIVQQRDWLPVEIGTVTWRILGQPCCGVFIPWYLGVTGIPAAFQKAPQGSPPSGKDLLDYHFNMPKKTWEIDPESASGIFRILGESVDSDYSKRIDNVRETWNAFEDMELELQPEVEMTALELFGRDRSLAREFLTLYSNAQAMKSLEVAKSLSGSKSK